MPTTSEAQPEAVTTIDRVLSGGDKSAEALAPVMAALEELAGDPAELAKASSKVWVASRDEAWRLPLGEAGVLGFFLGLLPGCSNADLKLNALRIIGNSCADRDANRKRVIDHPVSFESIVSAIASKDTQLVGTVVCFNVCHEYDPAQLAAIAAGTVQAVIAAIANPEFDDPIDHYVRLLELLLSHDTGKEAAPDATLPLLLSLAQAQKDEFDNILSVISILFNVLSNQRFQSQALESQLVDRLLDLVENTYTLASASSEEEEKRKKDASLLLYARSQLTESVGDLAASANFLTHYPLTHRLFPRIRSYLASPTPDKFDLPTAACLILGNVARTDSVCYDLIAQHSLHVDLLSLLSSASIDSPTAAETSILYSALGVLKNLAIAKPNKLLLADAGAFDAITRLLTINGLGAPQIYYSVAALARLLVVGTADNLPRLLALKPRLLEIYSSSEEPPIRIEIARALAVVVKLGGTPFIDDTDVKVIWNLIVQEKYPTARNEGWIALAILAGVQEKAALVKSTVERGVLERTVKEERKEVAENVGVLIAGLQKWGVGEGLEDVMREVVDRKGRKEKSKEEKGRGEILVGGSVRGKVEGSVEGKIRVDTKGTKVESVLAKELEGGLR